MTRKYDINKLIGNYKLVLGLEIHLHVKTEEKMFCACSTENIYAADPNTHTCPVCLGLPGALPVPNKEAVEKIHLLGAALGCKIARHSNFDRKHYFYPDLPKGYQISQYKSPFCEGGEVPLSFGRTVALERIHLEEDTAKSFHEGEKTLIDFNKSGIPLIEMVTKPSIHFVEDAVEYAQKIQEIVRHLGVGEADMEKGQLRIEPNISLQTAEMEARGELADYKVEVKNINSFKFLEKAIVAEIARQREILESGGVVAQENRGFDERSGKTVPQRSKEEAHDYRYFPEPDIPPMEFSADYVTTIFARVPALPDDIRARLAREYGLSVQEAAVVFEAGLVELLEGVVGAVASGGETEVVDGTAGIGEAAVTGNAALGKKVAKLLVNKPEFRDKSVDEIVRHLNSENSRINDVSDLAPVVARVLEENAEIAAEIKAGKTEAVEFLVGQVMRYTKGKADALVVRGLLEEALGV